MQTNILSGLKTRRTSIMQELRALVSDAEKRNTWTSSDEASFDSLQETLNVVDERIDAIEANEERQAELTEARRPYEHAARPLTDRSTIAGEHRAGQWLANELRALVGSGTTGGGAYTPAEQAKIFFDLLAAQSVASSRAFARSSPKRTPSSSHV